MLASALLSCGPCACKQLEAERSNPTGAVQFRRDNTTLLKPIGWAMAEAVTQLKQLWIVTTILDSAVVMSEHLLWQAPELPLPPAVELGLAPAAESRYRRCPAGSMVLNAPPQTS